MSTTPGPSWSTGTAFEPTQCSGFHCGHAVIKPGDLIHVLDLEGRACEEIKLCDTCWRRGQDPPPTPPLKARSA